MSAGWRRTARRLLLWVMLLLAGAAGAAQKLRVGVYENPPEIAYAEHGPEGIFVDILEDIARAEGWSIEYVPGTLPEGMDRLRAGTIDLMVAVARSPEREASLAFAREPVLHSWSEVYVSRASKVRTLLDLSGKRVAVPVGTKQHAMFAQLAKDFAVSPTLVTVKDFPQAVDAVASGEAEAVVTNPYNGAWRARAAGLKDTAIMFAPMNIHFAGRKHGDPAVLAALDRHVAAMKNEPASVYFDTLRKWAPPPGAAEMPAALKWAFAAAAVLTALAAAWGATLQRAAAKLRASEQLQRHYAAGLAHVFDHSADVICVLDAQFRHVRVNGAAQRLWGWTPQELEGRSCLELLPAGLRDAALADLTRVRAGTPTQAMPAQVVRKDGSLASVLWSAAWSEERQQMYCIGRDDTERRRLITRLQAHSADLELVNSELRSFSQMVSHDLRAPVSAVTGFLGKVLRDSSAVLPERSLALLQRALAAARRMDQIIADLLTLARLSEQELHRQPCDISRMAAEIVAALREGGGPGCPEVVIEPGLRASADPQLLRLALENLVGNAWKFSSRTPHARVAIGRDAGAGEVFCVRDNGAGFDMEYAAKLFQPFQRLHSHAEFEGTGIGLTIAHRVITRHEGRIWAESAPGAGAVFRFTLA